jgi:hypothetical protein
MQMMTAPPSIAGDATHHLQREKSVVAGGRRLVGVAGGDYISGFVKQHIQDVSRL